ncbi:MAG: UDP-3-O-(3-hydroxymyristoyl)glucosamine N-acyltransferase [Cyanobacteria bacterium P01_G01_bin.38]
MKFSDLVQRLGSTMQSSDLASSLDEQPDLNPEIRGVDAIATAPPHTLSYIEGAKYAAQVETTQASALILPVDPALQTQATTRKIAWVATPHPRLIFAQAIAQFYQPFQPVPEIHPSAVIHPTAQVGKDVYIGPHVAIQANTVLGDGVCIHPNVTIYPDAHIGDRTVLHANCVIHERAHLGADCVIHAGAVVGSEGFGFVPSPQGLVKMHQSGRVVLEDHVEIGCNTAIDRPAIGETRIGRNTKLDNLVQIGHGCTIGQSTAISAQVGFAGRVHVGNGVMMGGQVGISNDVTVGDGAIAAARSGVIGDVAPKEIVSGYPAIPNRLWLRASAIYKKLPDLYKTVRKLQKQAEL